MTAVFERAVHSAEPWIMDVMHRLGWNDSERALRAFRVVVHALRDRLGVNEVAHLGAQLPQLLRGVFYEGRHPAGKPLRMHREEFLQVIEEGLQHDDALTPRAVCHAVLAMLRTHISPGEVDKILGCLPQDMRDLWI